MLRRACVALAFLVSLSLANASLAQSQAQYARFQIGEKSALFQSAERTLSATDQLRPGELTELYRQISGEEWTTEKEAKGGALELAFLDALAKQGWEVVQMTIHEDQTIYLLRKQRP